jgi:hypothetical protein
MKEFDRSAAAKKGWLKSREKYEAYQKQRREEAFSRFTNPNCETCKSPLGFEKLSSGNKFCSHSCAASLTNAGPNRPRRQPVVCPGCSVEFMRSFKEQTFCSGSCKTAFSKRDYIDRWLSGKETGLSGEQISRHIRAWLLEKYDNKCTRCGWNEINQTTGTSPLNVEHIDGNYKNNHPDNLTILCPNCHSLTSTYGSLNIGRGRENRYKNKSQV